MNVSEKMSKPKSIMTRRLAKTALNWTLIAIGAFIFSGCDDDPPPIDHNTNELTISLNHQWDGEDLQLNSWYTTFNSDSFMPTKLVYHINNFVFMDASGGQYSLSNTWFMVNSEETLKPTFKTNTISDRQLTSVKFTIGVSDSATNASGALNTIFTDPMYWGMANGYINFKLEGKSPSVSNEGVILHTGGYLAPYIATAEVEIFFPSGGEVSGNLGTNNLTLNVDLAEYFDNPNLIDLSTTNEIHAPSDEAVTISKNWPSMFTFGKVN